MKITTQASKYGYDLKIKGQNLILLKTATLLILQTPLWCFDGVPCGQRSRSHILKTFKIARNTYIFFIYFERGCSYSPQCLHIICRLQQTSQNIFMTLKLRVKVKYFLKSVLRLITQTPHSCIDGVLSYLAQ